MIPGIFSFWGNNHQTLEYTAMQWSAKVMILSFWAVRPELAIIKLWLNFPCILLVRKLAEKRRLTP